VVVEQVEQVEQQPLVHLGRVEQVLPPQLLAHRLPVALVVMHRVELM
jgi:hypothetical protein